MNKKAFSNFDDLIILFACFVLIGASIVLGVWIFYSADIDIRLEEAKSMNNKLFGAVFENNYFNDEALNPDFNILHKAGIEEEVMDSGNYYFDLTIFEDDNEIKNIVNGSKGFRIQCRLPGKYMAKCYEKELRLLDKEGNEYKIKILTGSNQLGSRL